MALKVADGKALAKREFWPSKGRIYQRTTKSKVVEAISVVNGGVVVSHTNEDGVVRMKIVVRKQDLKQMLVEVMRERENNKDIQPLPLLSTLSPVERRLHLLKRRHLLRVNAASKESRNRAWRPALHSIPEEL